MHIEQHPSAQGALAQLARACMIAAGASLLGIALVQLWQVFTRYVLNDSPGWTEPVTLLLLATAMMLSAAAGVRANAHFGFTIALQAAPPRVRRVLDTASALLCGGIGVLLAIGGAQLLRADWDVAMPATRMPQGALYAPISVGGVLIAVFALERAWRAWHASSVPHVVAEG